MKREEQIKMQADTYADNASNYMVYQHCDGSTEDDIDLIEKAYIEGAKGADKTMIEKACKWIEENLTKYLMMDESGYYMNDDEFIYNFKKAMEK